MSWKVTVEITLPAESQEAAHRRAGELLCGGGPEDGESWEILSLAEEADEETD